jgi:hypothetical protein
LIISYLKQGFDKKKKKKTLLAGMESTLRKVDTGVKKKRNCWHGVNHEPGWDRREKEEKIACMQVY